MLVTTARSTQVDCPVGKPELLLTFTVSPPEAEVSICAEKVTVAEFAYVGEKPLPLMPPLDSLPVPSCCAVEKVAEPSLIQATVMPELLVVKYAP